MAKGLNNLMKMEEKQNSTVVKAKIMAVPAASTENKRKKASPFHGFCLAKITKGSISPYAELITDIWATSPKTEMVTSKKEK